MRRLPRHVVVADLRTTTVALQPVENGSGLTMADVRALCASAAVEVRSAGRATFIRRSQLVDVEALAEHRGWLVVRRQA